MGEARDVRLIVGAVGVSALGDVLLWVPLTLHLQDMTDSGIAVAAMLIALWGPVVVLAPAAGLLVDRREARGLLIAASVAQAVFAAGLALALDSLAAILLFSAAIGVGNAVSQPAEFALVPVIAGGSDTTRLNQLNGYVETARYVGMTAGPALGGVLAAAGGTDIALFVNAATFLALAGAAAMLHARRPGTLSHPEDAQPRARDGIAHLFRDRTLATVVGVAFVSLLFLTASATAEVFFLKQDVGVGDSVYGLVFASWTIGMVVGAVALSRRIGANHLALVALLMIGLQGIGLGLPTVWLVAWFAAAMWFLGGVGHGTKNVLVRTLIQERVPARAHGQAFAAYNGLRNGAELFALAAGGLLVAAIGARETLALAGALPALAALAGLAYYRRAGGEPGVPVAPASPDVEDAAPVPLPGAAE
ncbi:MAG TPA: MFS transporter [Solirubrobacterales bacterium]|nr:MFS transporter [Solirubrobacterales bacterium]